MPALQLTGIRQLLAGTIYIIYFMLLRKALPKGKEWWPVLTLSLLNFVLSNGLSTWGVKYISAGLGSIIGAIFPLWLVVINIFTKQSKMPRNAITGLMLGFGGICVIFFEHLNDLFNASFRFGILISVAATWSWAFGILYTKKQAHRYNPYFSTGLQMFISGIVLYGASLVSGMHVPLKQIPWQSWTAIVYLVLISSVISFIAYLYALQHLPTSLVSVYAYMNPIVAVLLGWLLLGERLSIYIGVGGAITLLGVYLVNATFRKAG